MERRITIEFDYMSRNNRVAHVTAYSDGAVNCILYTKNPLDNPLPLGSNMKRLMEFFESRCFPKDRGNARQLLDYLGLEFYDPYAIVLRTRGQQNDDFYWLRFKGDTTDYNSIKFRD